MTTTLPLSGVAEALHQGVEPGHKHELEWLKKNLPGDKHALAEKYLKMAILLNPKMCLAYNNIAMVHEVRRQTEDAIEAYGEAIKLCPDYQEPLFHLGVLYQNQARHAEAQKTLMKCVKLDPDAQYGRRCKRRLQ